MDGDLAFRVLKAQLFMAGHSYEEMGGMTLQQFGDVVGYLSGKSKAEEKLRKKQSGRSSGGQPRRPRRGRRR